MKEPLSMRIDSALKAALEKLAEVENRSLSNYILTVLWKHVAQEQMREGKRVDH
jgi:predicted transcriptional regulator